MKWQFMMVNYGTVEYIAIIMQHLIDKFTIFSLKHLYTHF